MRGCGVESKPSPRWWVWSCRVDRPVPDETGRVDVVEGVSHASCVECRPCGDRVRVSGRPVGGRVQPGGGFLMGPATCPRCGQRSSWFVRRFDQLVCSICALWLATEAELEEQGLI